MKDSVLKMRMETKLNIHDNNYLLPPPSPPPSLPPFLPPSLPPSLSLYLSSTLPLSFCPLSFLFSLCIQNISTGVVTLYMKGADAVMANIVKYNDWLDEEVSEHL